MKFTRFLKIFGVAIGILAIAGTFTEPNIQPQEIAFEYSEYKEDSDFEIKITTPTENVTRTEITLSFPNASEVVEKDGKISDGVITIPKTVKIGESFKVELVKVINDSECDGMDWVKGGHSIIRATSTNPDAESARTAVHIDVPVYNIDVQAKVSKEEDDSNIFVLDTSFYTYIKFYPQRSAYQYSFDGNDGYELIEKNAYFMLATGNDTYISQVGVTNEFNANNVGNNSVINGYVFGRTKKEESVLGGIGMENEQERHAAILQEIRTILSDPKQIREAFGASKSVDVVDIDVDSFVATGEVQDVLVATKYTIYANNSQMQGSQDVNLAIRLLSNYNQEVNLQSKLKNIGITFLYKQGNSYFSAINNENDLYNVIELPSDGYGRSEVIVEDDVAYTYFFPVLTSNINNYHWEFAVSRYCDADSIYIQIGYFDNDVNIEHVRKSFSTKIIVSNAISWSDTENVNLTIVDGENPIYEDYDVKPRAVVPQNNLYQTKKYFAYSSNNQDLQEYIYAKDPVNYSLGSQNFDLYELADGIVQPHSKSAHGISFNVIFVTVQTDYQGNEILSDDKYVIIQYSQDHYGAISAITVSITKTLYSVSYGLVTSDDEEDLIVFTDDNTGFDALAYVDGTLSPFDVILSYENAPDEDPVTEENIFRQAVTDGNLRVVAKVNSSQVTDLVTVSRITVQTEEGKLKYRFSLTIKELPHGTSDLRITLYVVYDKGKTEDTFKVDKYNEDKDLSYIEVYNGEAVTFAFNLNICDDGEKATAEDRRVSVQTTLESSLIDMEYYVDTVDTTYKLENVDIASKLFTTVDNIVDYGNLDIVVKDKHGKYPKSSLYVLESSNTSALVVTDQKTIVFTGTGDAELKLLHKNNEGELELKDTLYFTSQSDGAVSKVTKYDPLSSSGEPVVEYERAEDEYDFKTITISVNGYAGLTIPFNNTSAKSNLLTYYYSYGSVENANLINKMIFSLANVEDEQLETSGHVTFAKDANGDLTAITFNKDFGQRRTIQILVSVKELGISQIVILDVKANIAISVTPKDNPIVADPKGSSLYNGIQVTSVYADTVYKVEVVIDYTIKPTSTYVDEYAFVVYDTDTGDSKAVTRSTTGVYIAKIYNVNKSQEVTGSDVSIKRDISGDDTRYVYEYYFVFTSQSGTLAKTLILSLKKNDMSPVDVQKDLYLSINQNIKVELSGDNNLYLDTKNIGGVYGDSLLYAPDGSRKIKIGRIVNNGSIISEDMRSRLENLDKEILIDFANEAYRAKFAMSGYTLSSKNIIVDYDVVSLNIVYNNTIIQTLSLNVRPNITQNFDNKQWILYGNTDIDYYLKLVNGKFYKYEDLLTAFNLDFANAHIEIQFTNDEVRKYLSEQSIDPKGINVFGADEKIAYGPSLVGKVVLENSPSGTDGYEVSFKIIILPSNLPFVIYESGEIDYTQENLYDLLDVEYLKSNLDRYHYEAKNSGNDSGENIWFEISADGEYLPDAVGIQHFDKSNVRYHVQNLVESDATTYAYIDQNGKLYTEQVGQDTFVVVYATLNDSVEESLIIPYVVKIPKELLIKTYYPYVQGESKNDYSLVGEDMLSPDPTFDMEYLSFTDGTVQVDMLERFSQNIPNYVNKNRYVIGKYVDGVFTRVENLSALSEVEFTVTDLWYYSPRWSQAENISNYATFSSNANGNGLLTIRQYNGIEKLRLRIEITTRSKILAAYYVSVGEIPTFNLTDENGTKASDTLVVNANDNNIKLGSERYKLSKIVRNGVTDATYLLNFYSIAETYAEEPNITINNATKIMTTSMATRNWQTELVAYTIYGQVCSIALNITSNYEHYLKENSLLVYDNIERVYKVNCGNVLDITSLFKVKDKDTNIDVNMAGCDISITTSYDQIYVKDESIYIGAVTSNTLVDVEVVYVFTYDSQEYEYNFNFVIKVMPYIAVNSINNLIISSLNMLSIEDITAGEQEVLDIMTELFKFGDLDQESWNGWIDNVVSKELGRFEVRLITENLTEDLFGAVLVKEEGVYQLEVSTSAVAIQTRVSFKVSFLNKYAGGEHELLASYFTFTVTPTFRLVVNYPMPNSTAVVAGETYYFNTEGTNNINFNDKAIFASYNRIQVLPIDEEHDATIETSRIYIKTLSPLIKKGSALLNSYENGVPLSEANFTIEGLTETQSAVVFGIYFKVAEDVYTALGSYNLLLCRTGDVFTALKSNFNNGGGKNEEGRPESIYIGKNYLGISDNVMSRINASVKIPVNAIIDRDVYLKIKKVGNIEVVCDVISLGSDSSGQTVSTNVYFDSTTINMSSSNIEYEIYELVDEEPKDYALVDAFGNSLSPIFTLTSRISLIYKSLTSLSSTEEQTTNETVDFFKMYSVLNVDEINISESEIEDSEKTYRRKVKVREFDLGTYFVDYKFDIEFETQFVSLSTGESTTLLKSAGTITSDYYRPVLNMRRISNASYYYSPSDFSKDGLKFDYVKDVKSYYTSSIGTDYPTEAPKYGYLSMTPVIKDDDLFYDYIFLAMGSPKEDSITVVLTVVVKYGSIQKDYEMTFVVSHDYQEEYLRNANNTINRQTDRNKLAAGEQYIFAIAGSINQLDNFVFITHKNKTLDIYSGNVASFFSVTFDNGGSRYIEGVGYNSNNDLIIKFKEIQFGNINLDIVFRDAYGYEFVYYVQIIAQYNPIYDSGDIVVYEQDRISVIDPQGTRTPSSINLPVTIEKRDNTAGNKNVRQLEEISLKFIPDEVYSEEYKRLVPNTNNTELKIDDGKGGKKSVFDYIISGLDIEKGEFQTNYIDQIAFLVGKSNGENVYSSDIAGRIIITIKEGDDISEISVDATLKERYTIDTIDTPYVRDDVPFSLIDIIDVRDNKSNIVIGERSLKNVQSVYLEYSVTDSDGQLIKDDDGNILQNPFDSDTPLGNNFKIAIQATNKNKGTVEKRQVVDKSGSFISLQNLFEIESLNNYSFKMTYMVTDDVSFTDEPRNWTYNIITEQEYNAETTHQNKTAQIEIVGKDNVTYHYNITITKCYIVEDQILNIAVRKIDNENKVIVQLYNKELNTIKYLDVPARATEELHISLREQGLTTNAATTNYILYTNKERTVVNGISNKDLLKLKGVEFVGHKDGEDDGLDEIILDGSGESTNTVKKYITKSADEYSNPTFKVSTDGHNVLYNEGTLKVTVKYALTNGKYKKEKVGYTTDLRITLKFVDIDTTQAYGSDIARKVEYQTKEALGRDVSIEKWAGKDRRPIAVVAGYTSASSFANGDDTTLFGNSRDFAYSINTQQSSSVTYVSVDANGKLILDESFDLENNYIAIDVRVKYGKEKDNDELLDTVLVKFRSIQAGKLDATLKNNQLVAKANNSSSINVAEMISLNDKSDSYWTGQEIITAFGSRLQWTSFTDVEPTSATFMGHSFTDTNEYALSIASNGRTNIAIKADEQDDLIFLRNIKVVNSQFEVDSIASQDEYRFTYSSESPSGAEIYDKLKSLVKFKNIYSETKTAQQAEFVLGDTVTSNRCNIYTIEDYVDPVQEGVDNTRDGEVKSYLVTFGYGDQDGFFNSGTEEEPVLLVYGSVVVRVYASEYPTITKIRSVDKTDNTDIVDIFDYDGMSYSAEYSASSSDTFDNYFVGNACHTFTIEGLSGEFALTMNGETLSTLDPESESEQSSYYEKSGTTVTIHGIVFDSQVCSIVISANGTNNNITLYNNIFDYLSAKYDIKKSLLKVRLVEQGDERFAESVSLDADSSVIKAHNNDPLIQTTTCKLEIYFTYTDDYENAQKTVVLYQNTYTISWNFEQDTEEEP